MRRPASSFRLDLAFENHLLPFFEFGTGEGGALFHGGAARRDADLGEGRLQLGMLQRLVDLAVETHRDRWRQAGGRIDAGPEIDIKARQPRLGDRRHVGIDRAAREHRCRDRPHAAVAGERHRAGDAGERELHLAAHHVRIGRADAAIRHVCHHDAGLQLDQLAGEMRRGADAGGSEIELAGIGLGVGQEFSERSHRQALRGHDHHGRGADDRDRLQPLEQVIRNVRQQRRIGDEARVGQQDGVAVGR